MQELSKLKWVGRLFNKHNIEDSLEEYSAMLDEAERAFQTATLIEIHYSVNMLQRQHQQQQTVHVDMPVPEPAPSRSASPPKSRRDSVPPPYVDDASQTPLEKIVHDSPEGAIPGVERTEFETSSEDINELMNELKEIENSGVSSDRSRCSSGFI